MLAQNAQRELMLRIRRALTAVSAAFVGDLKRAVSVPAPRRQLPSGKYVAITRAEPGAPPRVVTGRGRSSISLDIDMKSGEVVIRVGVFYMLVHEAKNHKWIRPTWEKNANRYREIFINAFHQV